MSKTVGRVTAIVAYNKKFVIGDADGKIPWNIKKDMSHFKKVTMGCPVIMGRVTYQTFPAKFRPLPGRLNILLSKKPLEYINQPDFKSEENPPLWFDEPENAIHFAGKEMPEKDAFIIGGEQIYKYCIDNHLVQRVIASEIHGHTDVKGAAYFPDLKKMGWQRKVKESFDEFTVVEFTLPIS